MGARKFRASRKFRGARRAGWISNCARFRKRRHRVPEVAAVIDALSMLPAFLLGWIVVRLLARLPWAVEIPVGMGVGAGISSAAFFLMTWANVASRAAIL